VTAKAPIFAAVACLVLAVGFYFLAWKPKDDEQTALENETAELEDEASRLRNELAALEQIRDNQAQIRATLDTLRPYIPEGPAQPTAVRQLQQAADDAGVEIASMQFGQPEVVQGAPETGDPNTVVASINASVSLEGRYFQIADFMRRVEAEVPRAVLVSQLGLGEGGNEGFPTLAGDWTGDLFAIVPTDQAQDAGDGGSGSPGGAGDGSDGADNGGGDLPEGGDDELQEAAG
jgi:Tfp pilus assembly protein PilO